MENFERLMLAAQVRQIAVELRDSARAIETVRAARNLATPFNPLNWDNQHPVEEFVPRALEALKAVDFIISSRL